MPDVQITLPEQPSYADLEKALQLWLRAALAMDDASLSLLHTKLDQASEQTAAEIV